MRLICLLSCAEPVRCASHVRVSFTSGPFGGPAIIPVRSSDSIRYRLPLSANALERLPIVVDRHATTTVARSA